MFWKPPFETLVMGLMRVVPSRFATIGFVIISCCTVSEFGSWLTWSGMCVVRSTVGARSMVYWIRLAYNARCLLNFSMNWWEVKFLESRMISNL